MTRTRGRVVNTPGLDGYVCAIALSIVAYGVLLGVVTGDGLSDAIPATVVVLLFGWPYAVPVGVLGAIAVHVLCRTVHRQWVHVAAAATVGVIGGAVFWGALAHEEPFGSPALLVGIAGALGRLAMVPRVRRRQSAVDRDFPASG